MPNYATGHLMTAAEINAICPVGSVLPFGGAAAPSLWLLCDGASYLRTDYPDLFTAIGTTYGSADGTHFNVPDCRGRGVVGYAASGGHVDVSTLGNNDGVATASRRPKHVHNVRQSNSAGSSAASSFAAGNAFVGNQPSDTGGTMTDTPAYLVLNYIIKT